MKELNDHLESSVQKDKLGANDKSKIIDIAGKNGAIDHSEIRELTKIILKLKPEEVDASMQAKFDQIMGKVKAQFA